MLHYCMCLMRPATVFISFSRVAAYVRVHVPKEDFFKPVKYLFVALICFASTAMAVVPGPLAAPEIDPGSAANALAVLGGASLIMRSRLKR